MSASNLKSGPSLLASVLLLSFLSADRKGPPFTRESEEGSGDTDVKSVKLSAFDDALLSALLGDFQPCTDPNCPACGPAIKAGASVNRDAEQAGAEPAPADSNSLKDASFDRIEAAGRELGAALRELRGKAQTAGIAYQQATAALNTLTTVRQFAQASYDAL